MTEIHTAPRKRGPKPRPKPGAHNVDTVGRSDPVSQASATEDGAPRGTPPIDAVEKALEAATSGASADEGGRGLYSGADEPVADLSPTSDQGAGMADVPRDGRVVVLISADGTEAEAYWRKTNKHERHRWVPTAFWAHPLSNLPVDIEAAAWRPRYQ